MGGAPANHIARWNGTSWSAIPASFVNSVSAPVTRPNGDLVAAGFAGPALGGLVRWNGTAWSSLGVNGQITTMAQMTNGDLVIGGTSLAIPGNNSLSVARWNGAAWAAVGPRFQAGSFAGSVSALNEASNGDLVAGGDFTHIGAVMANGVARWDGTQFLQQVVALELGAAGLATSTNALTIVLGAFFNGERRGRERLAEAAYREAGAEGGGSASGVLVRRANAAFRKALESR